jgi:hypothetical protein
VTNPFATAHTGRQYPDVAADADPSTGYAVFTNNSGTNGWFTIGGTSAASPLWAAITADADAQAGLRLGLLNPALYKILQNSSQAASDFHDITKGNNDPFCVPGSGYCDTGGPYYPATSGYDIATGSGTPNVAHLMPDLISLATNSGAYLGIDFFPYLSADVAGPVVSKAITLTSLGGASNPVNYSASIIVTTTANWLSLTPASGTINSSQPILMSANPGSLGAGDYVATVTFSGTTNGSPVPTTTMNVYLRVGTIHANVSSLNFSLDDTGSGLASQVVTLTSTSPDPQEYAVEIQDFYGYVNLNGFLYDALPGFPVVEVSASQPVTLTFGVNLNGPIFFGGQPITPGAYTAKINLISVPISSLDQQDIPINLQVSGQRLTGTPLAMSFNATPNGALPPPQTFTVTASPVFTSAVSVPVTATLTSPGLGDYFTLTPATALIPPGGTLTFTITPRSTTIAAGYYSGIISVTSGLNPQVVARTNLSFDVQPQPHLAIATPLGQGSSDLIFNVTSSTGLVSLPISVTAVNGAVSYSVNTGSFNLETPWLGVSPASSTLGLNDTGIISVTVNTTYLGPGTYQGYVRINDLNNPGADGPIRLAILVNVTGPNGTPTINYPLPYLSNGFNGVTTYVTLQNMGIDSANIAISYYNQAGTLISTTTTSLVSAGQTVLLSSVLPSGNTGSAMIASSEPLNVLVTQSTSASASGAKTSASAYNVSATNLGAVLYDPVALNNTQGGFNTIITVYNAGTSPNSGNIQYYDQDGNLSPYSDSFTLAPHTGTAFAQNGNSQLASDKAYQAIISTNGNANNQVTALITEYNQNTNFLATFQATNRVNSSTLYVPTAYNKAFGSYSTGMALANPNARPVTVTIAYADGNGFLNGIQQIIIPSHGLGFSYLPATILPTGFTGSGFIFATDPLVVTVNEAGAGGSGTYIAPDSGSQLVGLPAVANQFAGFVTGATILNITPNPVQVSVQYVNPDGTAASAINQYTIQPAASVLAYQGAASLPTGFFGTLLISSNAPGSIVATVNASAPGLFYTYTEPLP